ALASTVNYATATGTAGGADFTAVSGTLTFPAGTGARTQTVTVPIINDTLVEGTEQFYLNLSGATEAKVADPQGVGTILDDDTYSQFSGFVFDDRDNDGIKGATEAGGNAGTGRLTGTDDLADGDDPVRRLVHLQQPPPGHVHDHRNPAGRLPRRQGLAGHRRHDDLGQRHLPPGHPDRVVRQQRLEQLRRAGAVAAVGVRLRRR